MCSARTVGLSDCAEDSPMLDVIFLLLGAGLFGLVLGFAHFCDRL